MKKQFLYFVAVLLIFISCNTAGDIKPKEKVSQLKLLDSLETVNETAQCFQAHKEGGDLVIDSLKPAHIFESNPTSLIVLPCRDFNGFWHSHPDVLKMSNADVDFILFHQLDYAMISVGDRFGAWDSESLVYDRDNREFPNYTFNLSD